MKLYVWENVLKDYTPGIIFAFASDVREARRLVIAKEPFQQVRDAISKRPRVITKPEAFIVHGGG